MRVSDASFVNRFLAGFRTAREELSRSVSRLADGKKVRHASDDPLGAHAALEVRGRLVRLEGYLGSSRSARSDLATLDSVLGQAFEIVSESREVAMAGASNLLGDVNDVRAQKIDSLRDRLLGLANTSQNGRFLMSGTETLTAPFDPAGTYFGDDAESPAPIDDGQQVGATLSGRRVFQGVAGDLFQLLDDLATALRADDTAMIQTQIAALDGHLRHLGEVHADVGVRMQAIDGVLGKHEDELTRLRVRLDGIENVSLDQAAVELTQADSRYQALSGTASRVLGRSLFDFFG